jgi:hypothetical protein
MDIRMEQTERYVSVRGTPAELEELANQLSTWTPQGGWSDKAHELFEALKGHDDDRA